MSVMAGWVPDLNDQFWVDFWPNAGAGLVTGLVVGLALFWSERRSDKRSEKRESRIEWQSVRPTIERAILSSGSLNAQNVTQVGWGRVEIEEEMAARPIGKWIDDLKLPELDALKAFLEASSEFERAGREFELRCSHLVASATSNISTRDDIYRRLRLKSRHARAEVIDALLGPLPSNAVTAADLIFRDPEVQKAHRRHREALAALSTRRSELISALGLQEPAVAPLNFLPEFSVAGPHVQGRPLGRRDTSIRPFRHSSSLHRARVVRASKQR